MRDRKSGPSVRPIRIRCEYARDWCPGVLVTDEWLVHRGLGGRVGVEAGVFEGESAGSEVGEDLLDGGVAQPDDRAAWASWAAGRFEEGQELVAHVSVAVVEDAGKQIAQAAAGASALRWGSSSSSRCRQWKS